MSELTDEQLHAFEYSGSPIALVAGELLEARAQLAAKDAEIARLRAEQAQIDAALETWFYPGEFDNRVKAIQETARVWDGIVAALDIGDSDADVVKTIQDMVEYAGVMNETVSVKDAEIARLTEALEDFVKWSGAYPADIFIEPDYEKAHALLQAGGMTLDALSAATLRLATREMGKRAHAALGLPSAGE